MNEKKANVDSIDFLSNFYRIYKIQKSNNDWKKKTLLQKKTVKMFLKRYKFNTTIKKNVK